MPGPRALLSTHLGEELRRGLHSEGSWLVTCCLNVVRLRGHSLQAGLRLLQTSSGRGSPSESWTWSGVRGGGRGGCASSSRPRALCAPAGRPRQYPRGVVLNPGVCPQGPPGNVRRHFWLSQLGGWWRRYWHLEGGGQRRCAVPYTA